MPDVPAHASEPSVDALSYEQARDGLADVVRTLEAGGLTLEQSLALWERGERLADRCQRLLDDAQHRLEAGQRSESTNDSSAE